MAISDVEDILLEYQKQAKLHGEGYSCGDSVKANKAYKSLQKLLKSLVKIDSRNRLGQLLSHEDKWVEFWAAAHLLEHDEDQSISALMKLAKRDDMLGLEAQSILGEWRAGNIKFA